MNGPRLYSWMRDPRVPGWLLGVTLGVMGAAKLLANLPIRSSVMLSSMSVMDMIRDSRVQTAAAVIELAIAVMLLACQPRLGAIAALVWVCLLAGVASGAEVFGDGVQQCGCFGSLSVSTPAHFLILLSMAWLSWLTLASTRPGGWTQPAVGCVGTRADSSPL